MTVFDTWLDNRDRAGHGGNVIVSTALPEGAGIAYIDYANSLSHGWGDNDAPPVNEKRGPFPDLGHQHDNIVRDTVSAIEALSGEDIRAIVNRIPKEFLPSPRREKIADGLLSRRGIHSERFFVPNVETPNDRHSKPLNTHLSSFGKTQRGPAMGAFSSALSSLSKEAGTLRSDGVWFSMSPKSSCGSLIRCRANSF